MLDESLSMARPIEKEAEAVTRVGEWGFGVTGLCKSCSGDNFDDEQNKAWKSWLPLPAKECKEEVTKGNKITE